MHSRANAKTKFELYSSTENNFISTLLKTINLYCNNFTICISMYYIYFCYWSDRIETLENGMENISQNFFFNINNISKWKVGDKITKHINRFENAITNVVNGGWIFSLSKNIYSRDYYFIIKILVCFSHIAFSLYFFIEK